MIGIKMIGAGMYIPDTIASNEDFVQLVDTSDEWIMRRTGIKTRHLSDGELTWQMGLKAAKDAIADAGIDPSKIDMVIHTSVTADYFYPSMSNIIIGKLGMKEAFGIDISCACAGFVYGMDMAQRYLASDDVKTVLIVSSENITKTVDYTDRSTCVLFGDGAGAVIVQKGEHPLYSFLRVEGDGAPKIFAHSLPPGNAFCSEESRAKHAQEFPQGKAHFMHMDGREVYKFATRVIPYAIEQICKKAQIEKDELALIVPHQANIRIIETAAKTLEIPLERFYTNIHEYGNISSACIPVCLCELKRQGRLKAGDKIAIVGFGAGLIYGGAVFTV